MLEVKVTLQKKLSIKPEEELEILVASGVRGLENWMKVCQQNTDRFRCFIFSRSCYVKITKNFFRFSNVISITFEKTVRHCCLESLKRVENKFKLIKLFSQ